MIFFFNSVLQLKNHIRKKNVMREDVKEFYCRTYNLFICLDGHYIILNVIPLIFLKQYRIVNFNEGM